MEACFLSSFRPSCNCSAEQRTSDFCGLQRALHVLGFFLGDDLYSVLERLQSNTPACTKANPRCFSNKRGTHLGQDKRAGHGEGHTRTPNKRNTREDGAAKQTCNGAESEQRTSLSMPWSPAPSLWICRMQCRTSDKADLDDAPSEVKKSGTILQFESSSVSLLPALAPPCRPLRPLDSRVA